MRRDYYAPAFCVKVEHLKTKRILQTSIIRQCATDETMHRAALKLYDRAVKQFANKYVTYPVSITLYRATGTVINGEPILRAVTP